MKPGEKFGPYRIVKMLGRGAMGEVYLAEHGKSQVAIKVVYRGSNPDDEEIFRAERLGAELQQKLSTVDRRVVHVRGLGVIHDDLVIEMEYVDGEDLSTALSRGPFGPGRAAVIGIELCEMLEHLHQFTTTIGGKQFVGVVHGDLKPRNIRINAAGRVKVMDFGIAKALSSTRRHTENVFASTAYCSPERLETQNINAQSDLWSVGVLLYQMVSGRLPFDEPAKERLERRIRSFQPPEPLPVECPKPLRDIVFKMLARDSASRFQTAREAREDLERFIKGEPVLVLEDNATVRTLPPPGNIEKTVRKVESPSLQSKSTRRRVWNGCLIVIGALTVAALSLGAHQVWVWTAAGRLTAELQTQKVSNLNDAWGRYQELQARSHVPFLLWSLKRTLKAKLMAAGDDPIREYRESDSPTVRESQWRQALSWFSHALELDPGDRAVQGRLHLCEGHVERINAKGLTRAKGLNMAVVRFREAAELLKRSPDPYLGLTRIYVYDLNDMDRAEDALNRAAEYGHPAGNREKVQLADGYRRRADRIWRESAQYKAIPKQEKEYLERARKDYQRALDLYQQIGLWGDAYARRSQVLQSLQAVEVRLKELHKGWWPF